MLVLICKTLSLLHLRMFCAKFGWNWSCGSRKDFFRNNQFIFDISVLFHLKIKGWALRVNKLEFPSPKDNFCQVWLELAQWFWRRWWKCEKFTTTTTKTTPTTITTATKNGKMSIRMARLNLRFRWAKTP